MKINAKIIGEGQPLVILHGLFGMLDNWNTIAKILSKDYMVIFLDLPNHGKSDHIQTFSIPIVAEQIMEFLASNWIYECYLLGHSLGGKVAMQIALTNEEAIEKLVVVDIGPKAYQGGHEEIFEALGKLDISDIQNRGQANKRLFEYIHSPVLVNFLLKNLKYENGHYAWKFNLDGLQKDYENILKPIEGYVSYENPSLFIRGENSNYILDEDIHDIKKQFPLAEIVSIPQAGHWVHAEQRELFVQAVDQFLKS